MRLTLAAAALALPALTGIAHAEPAIRLATGDNACQPGEAVLTMQEAEAMHPTLCSMLPPWHIVRLADGGVIDGPGYGCHIYVGHAGGLGHTFCIDADFSRAGSTCPDGTLLADKVSADINRAEACGVLASWDIARLSNGGSMDGPGYGCGSRATDARALGNSLCRTTFLGAEPPPPPPPSDLPPPGPDGYVDLVVDLGGLLPVTFEAHASDIIPTADGYHVQGDLRLRTVGGVAIPLLEVTADFHRGADGELDGVGGTARLPIPHFGLLSDLQLVQDPGVVTFGLDRGDALDALDAPLDPDTTYLYFQLDAGFAADSGALAFSAPGGVGATFVLDPADPFFFFRGDLPPTGPLARLDGVGVGISVNGNIGFTPDNTWGTPAGDLAAFDGHLYLSGTIPFGRYPFDITGDVIVGIDGAAIDVGGNGTLNLSYDLNGFSFSHALGHGTARGAFAGDAARLAFSGISTVDSPSLLPVDYPVAFEDSNVRIAGQLSDDLDRNYLHAVGEAVAYTVPIGEATLDIDPHSAALAGRVALGGLGIGVSGALDPSGVALTGSVDVSLPFPVPDEALSGLVCGTRVVTDAARCGTETVTNAALCGTHTVVDSVCSVVCWGGFIPFCDDVCDTVTRVVPNTCQIPRSCDIDISCDEYDSARLEGSIAVTLDEGGLRGDVQGSACLPDIIPGIGGCHPVSGGHLDLDGSPEACFDVALLGEICISL